MQYYSLRSDQLEAMKSLHRYQREALEDVIFGGMGKEGGG